MGDHSSRRPVARTLKQSTRTAGPEPALSFLLPSLFDLAPGGVCRAASVTVRAVRSYRTLSPFAGPRPLAVCSLWHFPLLRLPEAAGRYPAPWFPWSPDFPPPLARRRSPDPLASCGYSANERRLRAIARTAEVGWGADVPILPVAKRWGGGPSPQAMVEGLRRRAISPSVSAPRCHLPMACGHREDFMSAIGRFRSLPLDQSPSGCGSSSASRIARHSPSIVPSISSGRKRRWNATVAAKPSVTS